MITIGAHWGRFGSLRGRDDLCSRAADSAWPDASNCIDSERIPVPEPDGFETPSATFGSSLLRYIRRHRGRYVVLFALLVLSAALTAAGPWLLGLVFDRGLLAGEYDVALLIVAIAFVVQVAAALTDWVKAVLFAKVSQDVVRDVRLDLYRRLTGQGTAFYSRYTVGDLLARLEGDCSALETIVGEDLLRLLSDGLLVLAMAAFLAYLDVRLLLLACLVIPVAYTAQSRLASRVSAVMERLRERASDLYHFTTESVANMLTFQNHAREPLLVKEYEERTGELRDSVVDMSKTLAASGTSMQVVGAVASAVILGVGGYEVINGRLTVGSLVAFQAYFFRILGPAMSLARVRLDFSAAQVAWGRIWEILGTDDVSTAAGGGTPDLSTADIVFDDVTFGYEPGVPVFEHASWRLPAGGLMLLQGPSGSGKTTTARLLLRHLHALTGAIRVGDIDLREVDTRHLRSSVFMLEQDPLVISGTLRENLTIFADGAVDDLSLNHALHIACLDDFVRGLPMGLDAMLGERGVNISGGQRQRIAIARAVLADRPVLIMDECTSAIDMATEAEIMKRMAAFLADRTVILITHRPSGIAKPALTVRLDGAATARAADHAVPGEAACL